MENWGTHSNLKSIDDLELKEKIRKFRETNAIGYIQPAKSAFFHSQV
jgi:hypothetical protein